MGGYKHHESSDKFNELFNICKPQSYISDERFYTLYRVLQQVSDIPGAAAEVGVFKGGSAKFIAKMLKDKALYIFDTFEGLPAGDPKWDGIKVKEAEESKFKVDYEQVKSYLADCPNIKIYKGLFPGTAGPIEDKRFCFVHLDVDLYKSYIDCLEFFYPRMVVGGIMIFDDYGFPSCPGAHVAIDEFLSDKRESVIYFGDKIGQGMVIKK